MNTSFKSLKHLNNQKNVLRNGKQEKLILKKIKNMKERNIVMMELNEWIIIGVKLNCDKILTAILICCCLMCQKRQKKTDFHSVTE